MEDVKTELQQFKELYQAQSTQLDGLSTTLSNIGTDVKSLLDKIAALPDVSAEVAELKALGAEVGGKIQAIQTAASGIDDQVPATSPQE